jgi:hypothetical protein
MEVIGQQTRDEIANGEQLNLLSIFNFVMGGLNILGAFIMMAYTALFGFISNRLPQHGGEEAEVVFTIFTSVLEY